MEQPSTASSAKPFKKANSHSTISQCTLETISPTKRKDLSVEEKLRKINEQLHQVKQKRLEMDRSSSPKRKTKEGGKSSPNHSSSISPDGHQAKQKKPALHHPKLDYIIGQIVFSPYMTRPQDSYPRETFDIPEKLFNLSKNNRGKAKSPIKKKKLETASKETPSTGSPPKVVTPKIEEKEEELPFDVKAVKKKFFKEVFHYNVSFTTPEDKLPLNVRRSLALRQSASLSLGSSFSRSPGSVKLGSHLPLIPESRPQSGATNKIQNAIVSALNLINTDFADVIAEMEANEAKAAQEQAMKAIEIQKHQLQSDQSSSQKHKTHLNNNNSGSHPPSSSNSSIASQRSLKAPQNAKGNKLPPQPHSKQQQASSVMRSQSATSTHQPHSSSSSSTASTTSKTNKASNHAKSPRNPNHIKLEPLPHETQRPTSAIDTNKRDDILLKLPSPRPTTSGGGYEYEDDFASSPSAAAAAALSSKKSDLIQQIALATILNDVFPGCAANEEEEVVEEVVETKVVLSQREPIAIIEDEYEENYDAPVATTVVQQAQVKAVVEEVTPTKASQPAAVEEEETAYEEYEEAYEPVTPTKPSTPYTTEEVTEEGDLLPEPELQPRVSAKQDEVVPVIISSVQQEDVCEEVTVAMKTDIIKQSKKEQIQEEEKQEEEAYEDGNYEDDFAHSVPSSPVKQKQSQPQTPSSVEPEEPTLVVKEEYEQQEPEQGPSTDVIIALRSQPQPTELQVTATTVKEEAKVEAEAEAEAESFLDRKVSFHQDTLLDNNQHHNHNNSLANTITSLPSASSLTSTATEKAITLKWPTTDDPHHQHDHHHHGDKSQHFDSFQELPINETTVDPYGHIAQEDTDYDYDHDFFASPVAKKETQPVETTTTTVVMKEEVEQKQKEDDNEEVKAAPEPAAPVQQQVVKEEEEEENYYDEDAYEQDHHDVEIAAVKDVIQSKEDTNHSASSNVAGAASYHNDEFETEEEFYDIDKEEDQTPQPQATLAAPAPPSLPAPTVPTVANEEYEDEYEAEYEADADADAEEVIAATTAAPPVDENAMNSNDFETLVTSLGQITHHMAR